MRSPESVFWGVWRTAEQLSEPQWDGVQRGYRSLSCELFSLEGAPVSGGETLVGVGNPLLD